MTKKFKVGDRVKMKDVWPHTHIDWAGSISIKKDEIKVIVRVCYKQNYMRLDNGSACWFKDMELVASKNVIGGELC